ncbi:MAG: HyaD/HybD family hydrogenase maturation endopeptidase [Desulfuromonadales bacterium]|nr:HyaD/HybD family hydrogenase maturation endopeptidase [Desulfuromonadales bacterium]
MSVLVLGIGNLIMTDDGIGVRVVQQLAKHYRIPEGVELLEGGTLGLNLLSDLKGVERLLVVDALETGQLPGTLQRLEGDEIPLAFETRLSPHELGLKDLLTVAAMLGDSPQEVVLWGIQPERLDLGEDLSASVAARLDDLTDRVADELRRWGLTMDFR